MPTACVYPEREPGCVRASYARGLKCGRRRVLNRRIEFVVLLAALAGGQLIWPQKVQPSAAEKKVATKLTLPPSPSAVLPDAFDGWAATDPPKTVNDAATLDLANAAALKEYGLDFGVVANYKREGDTLSLRALRFDDESGAYGAYSYYRQNGWPKESIGSQGAASDKNRVLFWRGSTVVDATFSHIEPMSCRRAERNCRQAAHAWRQQGHCAAGVGLSAAGEPAGPDHALCAGAALVTQVLTACYRQRWFGPIWAPKLRRPTTRFPRELRRSR